MENLRVEKTQVIISTTTREALRNLFVILDINDPTFDERLFTLASRAFAANADISDKRLTLRRRSANGQKIGRKRMEIKEDVYWRLRELHGRLFPYLPWTSWSWYLNELADIAEERLHE